MMTIQFTILFLAAFIIIFCFAHVSKKCNDGHGEETVPNWLLYTFYISLALFVLTLLSLLIF